MISLDVKTKPSSPISLAAAQSEGSLSFSELLKGVSTGKNLKDAKTVQNGTLVLALGGDEKEIKSAKTTSKSDKLLALLKNNDEAKLSESSAQIHGGQTKENFELNPQLSKNLSVKEIKTLVMDAKEFLKSKIIQSDDYKKAQIKELPKTLKGLAQMAKKFGIDVSKVSFEEIRAEVKIKNEDVKVSSTKETQELSKGDTKAKVPHANEVNKSSAVAHAKASVEKKTADASEISEIKNEKREQLKQDDKNINLIKDVKSTPLFKAASQAEYTTEQFVQTKQFKVEEKTPKDKADETLKLLLRTDKSTLTNTALTADFSVATAKVLAPSAASDAAKGLEKLLHSELESQSEGSGSSKSEGLSPLKAESFEVKLNEAKQMIKYLSSDVKTAIEDYKSPFSRVKVQLNPQNLGEVDLTIVQRGKNLHVHISSNNSAINTLALNANELRTQLNNSGINNATLNFNNHSDSSNPQGQQQQNRHNERQAQDEYKHYENEETHEEVLSSLEIVVPKYI
ncbi:flagellar hook-length control protein FliK [bacterium]|nr:flagellar hook-length control protein FliK [bacterium]MBU1995292.1 flagellar hook-length control protein FliK [bacterium]